jgi:microcystin-dependent protein
VPQTIKWELRYPAGTDTAAVPTDLQELAEDVENKLAPIVSTVATRPTAAVAKSGRFHLASDTLGLSVSDGSNWHDVPLDVTSALAHPGAIQATARSSPPSGWLLCDGAAVSRTTFAALFAAIGSAFGAGDGSTTFNVPDLRGRVPVGVDGSAGRLAANDGLAQVGGEEMHTLTSAELASHNHPDNISVLNSGVTPPSHPWLPMSDTAWASAPALGGAGATMGYAFSLTSLVTHTQGVHGHVKAGGVQNAGGGQAHNNLQPYQVVNWIIKT